MVYGIWRKASGVIKDTNGIWLAGVARRTPYRHRELERAVIRATSHDEFAVDYRSAQRVFQWIRASPSSALKPFMYALTTRVHNTRSWVVALKCLILLHGAFCCNLPSLRRLGRLPFDLSSFTDGHSKPSKSWPYSAFVRLYFAFLDHHAAYLADEFEIKRARNLDSSAAAAAEDSIGEDLLRVRKLQNLLDLLIQIKPMEEGMRGDLIVDAMDCVVIEIFDVYSGICSGIASVLVRIHGARAAEATAALGVLRRGTVQSEKLAAYFEICGAIGVLNANEFPKVERVPEEDIREVERIITALSDGSKKDVATVAEEEKQQEEGDPHGNDHNNDDDDDDDGAKTKKTKERRLETVISDEWEVFDDEDLKMIEYQPLGVVAAANPNLSSQREPHHHHHHVQQQCVHNQVLPDLITF